MVRGEARNREHPAAAGRAERRADRLTGAFTRYVKPTLLPWLALTAVLLIGLALVSIVGDIRRGAPDGDPEDGHGHRGGVVWLLVVPIVVLIFVTPPALRPQAATGSVTKRLQ